VEQGVYDRADRGMTVRAAPRHDRAVSWHDQVVSWSPPMHEKPRKALSPATKAAVT